MKKILLVIVLFVFGLPLSYSQIPPGYYDDAIGLNGEELQIALHEIIDDHIVQEYGDLWDYFEFTDKKTNGKVWDIYSDIPGGTPPYEFTFVTDQCGNYSQEGDCFNKEHSFPKSWFGGKVYPMYSDLFHVYPTDGYVNSKRSNYPYGEVNAASWTSLNGSKVGHCSYPGYSDIVFEPIDEYKGDLARSYFYISTRYYEEDSNWPGSNMFDGARPLPWALEMLLGWHNDDPVSQKEVDRNNEIYEVQENRNPFIDHPEWVEDIWIQTNASSYSHLQFNVQISPVPAKDILLVHISSPDKNQKYSFQLMYNQINPVFPFRNIYN